MKTAGLDIAITFDTTGSMYPVLAQVRSKVESSVKELFSTIEDLRIAIIAHGDYCDAGNPYTMRIMDFTEDESEICEFIRTTDKTNGGDADECYELVLNQARTMLDWGVARTKLLVLIGDASPHGVNYPQNTGKLDWVYEAEQLGEMGVKIYAVHALSYYRSSSKRFYESIAQYTKGVYLTLDQFEEVNDLIKATCMAGYNEEKLSEYVSIIREKGKISRSMLRNINRLKGLPEDTGYKHVQKEGLIAVVPGRFQVMTVDKECDIKGFVELQGIEFKKGRGFYELTKHETIQQYKEIIIQDKETGELFTGAQVRELLKLQPQIEKGGVKESLSSRDTKEYRIFVQSTSYNRKLMAGTTFMYEVNDIDVEGTTIVEEPKKVKTKKAKGTEVTARKKTRVKDKYSEQELKELFICDDEIEVTKDRAEDKGTKAAEDKGTKAEVKKEDILDKSEPCKLSTDIKGLASQLTGFIEQSSKLIQNYLDSCEVTDEELLNIIFSLENTANSLKKYL